MSHTALLPGSESLLREEAGKLPPFNIIPPESKYNIPGIPIEDEKADITYTFDEALSFIGAGPFQWKLLLVTGLFWSTDAMMTMVLTFLMPELTEEWNLSSTMDGAIGTAYFIGMLFGSIFWSNFSDRYGRKRAIILSSSIQIVFGLMCASSPDIYVMMALIFVTGFGVGGTSVAYTLYAEFAPKEGRGKYLVFQQSFWALGALLNACIAWVSFSFLNWRWYIILSVLPLILVFIGILFKNESARWLLTVNRYSEAVLILQNVAKVNKCPMPDGKLYEPPVNKNVKKGNFCDIFHDKYFHISILMLITMSLCSFSYFGIAFLSERLFDSISTSNKYWQMIISAFGEFPGVFVALLTVDRFGRRSTMIVYFALFGICMFLLMKDNIRGFVVSSTVLVFFGRMCISMAYIIVFIYYSEYFPTRVRNTSLGIAQAVSSMSKIGTTYLSQSDDIGYALYLYGLSGIIASFCCFALFHDTQDADMTEVVEFGNSRRHKKKRLTEDSFLFY